MVDLTNYLTITEAANIRGVSRQAIFALIRRERLPAIKLGNQWVIRKSDIRRFKPQPPGRPRREK